MSENSGFEMFCMLLSKAESKILDTILKLAKENNVIVNRTYDAPLVPTIFKTNSASFYDSDRKKMPEKFKTIGGKFIEDSASEFIRSRLSDTIKLYNLKLTIERGFNVEFNPDNVKELKPTPYAHFKLTIISKDTEGLFELNKEKGE